MFLVLGLASTAIAAERPARLTPTLGVAVQSQVPPSPTPVPDQSYVTAPAAPVVVSPAVLYTNVRVKDRRNIAPCAVPTIVQVPDPCDPCCCVNVEICAPACPPVCVKTSKCGTKVKYDYGDYEVEITSRRGRVTVDYDD
jgi:hypothetical protein